MKLLNSGNAKTIKGEKLGYITYGLHLAPYTLAGVGNVCPMASKGCADVCLNLAGRGQMKNVQDARIAKTRFFFADREAFMLQLHKEIVAAIKSAKRKGMIPCLRLNLTSDIQWEKSHCHYSVDGGPKQSVFDHFPDLIAYDYTKHTNRFGKLPANYTLTFSRSETNGDKALELAKAGHNIAVVFDKLPETWEGIPVVNGDETDLRFLDPKGCVVGLVAKGKAKSDQSGFVVSVGGAV